MDKKKIGKIAENKAVEFLSKNGYKILEKNYSNKLGEIDIIAEQKNIISFIEVKYREDTYFGLPEQAVNSYKQNKISKIAMVYIKQKNLKNKNFRFDVISITPQQINIIENAFTLNKFYTI